jgi:hypothetical protein
VKNNNNIIKPNYFHQQLHLMDTSKMPEVRELEELNLHNQQWTFTEEQSGLSLIFNGESPL